MALKATIYKASVEISDLDRNVFSNHNLTLACHPSESEQRMMVRLLGFMLNADASLLFSKGLCSDDEPELWQHSDDGRVLLWIEFGQLEETRIKKACSRAAQVLIYTYQPRAAAVWWQKNADSLQRYRNLGIVELTAADSLTALCQRNMQLNCVIQEGQIWLSDTTTTLQLQPVVLKPLG